RLLEQFFRQFCIICERIDINAHIPVKVLFEMACEYIGQVFFIFLAIVSGALGAATMPTYLVVISIILGFFVGLFLTCIFLCLLCFGNLFVFLFDLPVAVHLPVGIRHIMDFFLILDG